MKQNKPSLTQKYDISKIGSEYEKELLADPRYALSIDPENKLNLTEEERMFIMIYIEKKSYEVAALEMNLSIDEGKKLYYDFRINNEIRRLNQALYHYQINRRMMTQDELGGYLSAIIAGETFDGDKTKMKDKLAAAKLLMDIHKQKTEAAKNPSKDDYIDVEEDLKDLSVDAIKQLIEASTKKDSHQDKVKKEDIIDQINSDNHMTAEELEYLRSLSIKELIDTLNDISGVKDEYSNKQEQ